MATSEAMAAYAQKLRMHTSAQNKPVTEIAVFRLNPTYAMDHAAAAAEFESHCIKETTSGSVQGIRRTSWGFSRSDPETMVWMLDWDKIQDHWDFWQTPGFGPVMNTISKLFVPGRPLVRHYDFGEPGMVESIWIRLFVWDEGREGTTPEGTRAKALATGDLGALTSVGIRQGYAVDLDEMTWYCLLLGYENEDDASKEEAHPDYRGEDHVVELKFNVNTPST
ncbi:unnamed protein product [Periconia digitata]|uniref:Uncharacterized protein n=1 Tax=Periconia digitata TaxID=1303443 RepID=A0A9W4XII2_9PLEO|nr:unnamed protein product [Periconia digitata]